MAKKKGSIEQTTPELSGEELNNAIDFAIAGAVVGTMIHEMGAAFGKNWSDVFESFHDWYLDHADCVIDQFRSACRDNPRLLDAITLVAYHLASLLRAPLEFILSEMASLDEARKSTNTYH